MPTYQYACKDCDFHFEQVQAFSDPSLTICPNCEGHLRKVYGSVGVVFKGSGFYRTDSRAGANTAGLSADHKSETQHSTSNGGSSEGSSAPKPSAPAPAVAAAVAKASAGQSSQSSPKPSGTSTRSAAPAHAAS